MTYTSSDYLAQRWRRFAVYVNMNRAIPAFADGLKLGQRIALWLMRSEEKKKVSGLAGAMADSLLYVHGDAAAMDSVSRLAAPYLNNLPLLKGTGNFGTLLIPTSWSAGRYIEVAKTPQLSALLYSDLDILSMVDNYDGSTKMPANFLPMIPLVLLNGQKGSGVGFGSNIFPRDFKNIVTATLLAIENKPIPEELLVPVYTPNGSNTGTLVEYTKEGKGRWQFEGEFTVDNSTTVTVTRLPSVDQYLLEDYKEFLNELIEKDIINDYDDYSTDKIKIILKFPRGVLKNKTEEEIKKLIGLVKTNTEYVVVVGTDYNSLPNYNYDTSQKYPNPIERLIRDWVEWRFAFIEDRYRLLIQQTKERLNFLYVLKACFDEKLPDVFQAVANKKELKEAVREIATNSNLHCDDIIEERVVSRASYSWTQESYQGVLKEIDEQIDILSWYEELLASPTKRRNVFKTEVMELKKIKT